MTLTAPSTRFTLPRDAEATSPPERRGVPRDGVRLLASRGGDVTHHHFRDLPRLLLPGDLLVLNTSATLPAALAAHLPGGDARAVHVAAHLDDGAWVVEVRAPSGDGPDPSRRAGELLLLPGGVALRLIARHPDPDSRLWRAQATPPVPMVRYLRRNGRPIGYRYLARAFPLADHQTVYATQPGSAEMPSAGRPFTPELLVRLMARAITVAPVVLHTGVSSPEHHEPPQAERFAVPADTARLVRSARGAGRRIVAVGTTAVRALESAVAPDGEVAEADGWTDLVICPDNPVRVVDGIITGLHTPEASHLLLLEAVAGERAVAEAYEAAVAERYRWHEFGGPMLFLP